MSPGSYEWEARGPTPGLDDFLAMAELDSNLWWRIGCGHHENLFDAAVEELAEQRALVKAALALCDRGDSDPILGRYFVAVSALRAVLSRPAALADDGKKPEYEVGDKVIVGGIEFTKMSDDPFGSPDDGPWSDENGDEVTDVDPGEVAG